jgi:hypothetical protein
MRNEQVTDYIENAPSPHKEILAALRGLIENAVPDATEAFKWGQPVYGKKKDFCYLKAAKSHVNLGFMNHEVLNDPDGLLEGTGKSMRHVKLRSLADVNAKLFKSWIKAAAE